MTSVNPSRHPVWVQPGDWVRLEGMDDWGVGQVQTVVGQKVTVNFEHAGKQVLDTAHATIKSAD